ncbi:MAG: carboxypeptidase-like regulatory domain-containing protein, partial [Leadbetterella sp.]
ASVDSGSHRIPYFIKIVAQAIPATFQDQSNSPEHYTAPLPANSITKMLTKPAEIKSLTQPFASYNGVPAEIGTEYYTRVSERLRHKNRAITVHDYEKLVLEYFPSIFKVKAITHTDPNCLCRDTHQEVNECSDKRRVPILAEKQKVVEDIRAVEASRMPEVAAVAAPVAAAEIPASAASSTVTIEGVVLDEKTNLAILGASIKLKNRDINTQTDAGGKFKISSPDKIIPLLFSKVGYETQEISYEQFAINKFTAKLKPINKNEVKTSTCCGPQVAPGHVLIVPIDNLKNRNGINRLQPRTSYRVLREIEAFLKKKTSPFVKIHARNPTYEEVLTAFRVKFHTGLDKGFYLKKLNEDIIQFITPWVFNDSTDVVFGDKMYASVIINFIERLPYVDFITDFMLYQIDCECCSVDSLKYEVDHIGKRGSEIKGEMQKEKDEMIPPDTTEVDVIDVVKQLNSESHKDAFLSDEASELWDFIRSESDTMLEWAIRNGLTWWEIATNPELQTKANQSELQLILKVVEWYLNFVKSMGLKTVYDLVKYFPVFKMGTFVEPSNPRSLLVSVPQHIIMLYEDEVMPDPCKVVNKVYQN